MNKGARLVAAFPKLPGVLGQLGGVSVPFKKATKKHQLIRFGNKKTLSCFRSKLIIIRKAANRNSTTAHIRIKLH